METRLTIALPKGKLFAPSIKLLSQCGFNCTHFSDEARTLVFPDENKQTSFIICRPTDIPTYVEYGAADLGIVGKDSLMEAGKNLYELVDLKYGYCRFVVAAPRSVLSTGGEYQWKAGLRIATKFPAVAKEFVKRKGLHAEIIKLHGNIELAPRVGLAELIIDIVSTGKTLQENNLVPLEEIGSSTARLVVNRASYRLKSEAIKHIVASIKESLQQEGGSP